jgi:hypothetical protein
MVVGRMNAAYLNRPLINLGEERDTATRQVALVGDDVIQPMSPHAEES